MRITLVTDAWTPQVNGVVRTLSTMVSKLRERGHEVQTITPDLFPTAACPGYPEIRLALMPYRRLSRLVAPFCPDVVHIATEGPLGWAARRWCGRHGMSFTTAFHTRFPEYVALRTGLPAAFFWPVIRRFHSGARAVLAATPALAEELGSNGIDNVRLWSRGVDFSQFGRGRPPHPLLRHLSRPIMLSVGRVAVEKNLDAFLSAEVAGSKVVVGDGPALAAMRQRYPDALFTGALHGEALASAYAAADIFVFPSLTDTFGLVMIEALASGLPVAGFPVRGPLDVIGPEGRGVQPGWNRPVGAVAPRLEDAIERALKHRADDCMAYARHFTWDASVDQFLAALTGGIERRHLPVAA
jgi:glycosyltransferase involved in cell wall biosynthesis